MTTIAAAGAALAFAARAWRDRHAVSFQGRVVVITGGSRGLGLELARVFGANGARLALVARDEAELQWAQVDLAARAVRVLTVPADVRLAGEVNRAIEKVAAHYGAIDVLVNNAGVIVVGPVEHMTLEDYEQAMAVHYWGPLHAMRAALPHLRRSPGARIVNVASIGGKIAAPHLAAYSGNKFALVGLSDAWRAELAWKGIRVTTVCPGLMRTGSPVNATFKGRHGDEFAWFTVADSLPVVTVSSTRAAEAIVEACRLGSPELVIGWPAKIAAMAKELVPGVVASASAFAAQQLPAPDPDGDDRPRLGRDTSSRWAPSRLTALSDRAAVANNETGPALPVAATTTRSAATPTPPASEQPDGSPLAPDDVPEAPASDPDYSRLEPDVNRRDQAPTLQMPPRDDGA